MEIKAKTRQAASKPAKATVKSKVASSKSPVRVVQASRASRKSRAKGISEDRAPVARVVSSAAAQVGTEAVAVRAANANIYEYAKLGPASAGFFLFDDARPGPEAQVPVA